MELAPLYSERQLVLDPCFVAFTHATNHPEVLSSGLPWQRHRHCAWDGSDADRCVGRGGAAVVPRREAGLPEESFLFCSFNSLYKITPTLFLAWVKVLTAVPNSVLWLLREPADAEANLVRFAKERGLHSSRIRFTDKASARSTQPEMAEASQTARQNVSVLDISVGAEHRRG